MSLMTPAFGLPARSRASGISMPWSTEFRDDMDEGIAQLLDDRLVELGIGALRDELRLLAELEGKIAHDSAGIC